MDPKGLNPVCILDQELLFCLGEILNDRFTIGFPEKGDMVPLIRIEGHRPGFADVETESDFARRQMSTDLVHQKGNVKDSNHGC